MGREESTDSRRITVVYGMMGTKAMHVLIALHFFIFLKAF